MSEPITASQAIALSVAATASAPVQQAVLHTPWEYLDVGAPVNVLLAIAFGAFVGVWNKRIEHKGNLVGAWLGSFIITLGVVVGGPSVTGLEWETQGFQAAVGMMLAFTSQNWGPELVKRLKDRYMPKARSRDDE